MIECQMYNCVVANKGAIPAQYIRVITYSAATTPYIGHCTVCFLRMYLKLYRFKKKGDIAWRRVDAQAQDAEGNPESIFGFPHQ